MKLFKVAVLAGGVALLSGCYYGPIYPWAACSPNGPPLLGCYYTSPCTAYHPNYFYRCHNHKCVTYSPYAPNKCDPVPFYTSCKYTACCQNYTPYF
jgi:hypothetical protein